MDDSLGDGDKKGQKHSWKDMSSSHFEYSFRSGEATFYNSKTQGNNMPFLVRVAIALMKHHAQKQVGKEIVYLASIS